MRGIFLVVALAVGCSVPRENPRTVQAELELEEATAMAVARWNAAAGVDLELVSAHGDVQVKRAVCRTEGVWGCGGHRVAKIDSPPEGYLELTVMHELAHALGAEHVSAEDQGVMHAHGYKSTGCITEADLASFCSGYVTCAAFNPEC